MILAVVPGALLLAGCDPPYLAAKPAVPVAPAASASPPAPKTPEVRDATNWWRHTLAAARTTPLRAEVTTTLFARDGKPVKTEHFTVEEGNPVAGSAPRYCLTRQASETEKGRTIISDGHTAWDYDPDTQVVWQRQTVSLQTPPQMQEGVAGASALAQATQPQLEPSGPEKVAGRAVQVLALRSKQTGHAVERRWIDRETGRTLRMEEYGGKNARLLRRWELAKITFGGIGDAELLPNFPAGAQLVDSQSVRAKPTSEAKELAHRVHLPLRARGFALRSVVRADALKSAEKAVVGEKNKALPLPRDAAHLFYRSGDQAISVFVKPQENSQKHGGKNIVLQPGPGWKNATLKGGEAGFTQETGEGSAVAWTEPNGDDQYIAVARMPLSRLMPVIEALAANREPASARGVPTPPENKIK